MFTQKHKKEILEIARSAIYEYVRNGTQIKPPQAEYLDSPSGVFVTLTEDGELRGCIGFPEAQHPLGEAIVRAAIYAATEDPRFPCVTPSELSHLSLEISVLSTPWAISDPIEIEVGKHGLILSLGRSRRIVAAAGCCGASMGSRAVLEIHLQESRTARLGLERTWSEAGSLHC